MNNIGDLVIYAKHGICRIDDICDRTIGGVTRAYYVLHPVENNHQLTISVPVDNENIVMLELVGEEEARELLETFRTPGAKWIDNANLRQQTYTKAINTGNRKEIALVINALIRRKIITEREGKKFYEQDRHLLSAAEDIMFKEMSHSLKASPNKIEKWVYNMIDETI